MRKRIAKKVLKDQGRHTRRTVLRASALLDDIPGCVKESEESGPVPGGYMGITFYRLRYPIG